MAELKWWGEYGFLQADPTGVYNAEYFSKYKRYATTELGRQLNNARLSLVGRHILAESPLVDVGVGCGQFVESRPHTRGYDVCPEAVAWLKSRDLWTDPYRGSVENASFWDSFEHIESPGILLARVTKWAFLSLPIFWDKDHVLRSKHFRPTEHYHYFTRIGLIRYMDMYGFVLREDNVMETKLGREDIGSFAFKRAK